MMILSLVHRTQALVLSAAECGFDPGHDTCALEQGT